MTNFTTGDRGKIKNLKITNILYVGLISFGVFSFSLPSLAVTIEEVPNPRQLNGSWVTDMADILTPETEVKINKIISDLEKKTGNEMAVVTVTETTSSTPKQFATQLFNRWGIGKAGKNNGVLFLISTGGKRVEIETGKGLQAALPNQTVKSIIEQQILPQYKQKDYNQGTISGSQALANRLELHQQELVNKINQQSPGIIVEEPKIDYFYFLNGFLLSVMTLGFPIIILSFIFIIFKSISKTKNYSKQSFHSSHKKSQPYISHPSYKSSHRSNHHYHSHDIDIDIDSNSNTDWDSSNSYDSGNNSSYDSGNNSSYDSGNNSSYDSSSSSSSYDSGSSSSSSDFGGGSSSGGGDGGSW